MSRFNAPGTLVGVVLLLIGVATGALLAGRMRPADDPVARPSAAAAPADAEQGARTSASAGSLVTGLPDFSRVAAIAVPSVTNISSVDVSPRQRSNDPFFQFFFGGDDDYFGSQRRGSLGSGVVVSEDGYILTNNHVIEQRTPEITVAFGDKREMRAKLVGVDELTDIAVLKVQAKGLPTMTWGDSSRLKVGEWVLAIGNPYQLSQSVSLGIVSALNRTNVGVQGYENFIQTDAAINPGNSGGALVNVQGELIGINTAIVTQSGGYQGIGLAVPSAIARRVLTEIVQFGAVRRGSIGGFITAPLTSQVAEDLGVRETKGAIVTRMSRASEAYTGGIRPGDVIVSWAGTTVEDPSHLVRLIADSKVGSTVDVVIVRDGKRMTLKLDVQADQGRRRTR